MSSKINILITGGTGFVYGNFIRYMLKNFSEYNISSIDDIKNIKLINTIYANKGHEFYMGDITNAHFVNNVFEIEKPDIVIHGADLSYGNNEEIIKSNILGTQILIDASIKYKVKKFIYASSDKVYGSLNSENDTSWTEKSSTNPQDLYSATKVSGELLVIAAHKSNGLNYIITRSCNNYGPRQSKNNLIPYIVNNILENKEVTIYNQGSELREYLHVQDACSAIKKIIDDGTLNETYNIGSGQEFSTIEVFNEICNIMGKGNELLKFVPNTKTVFRRSINSFILERMGWKPEFNFKKGSVQSVVKWFDNNKWFLK